MIMKVLKMNLSIYRRSWDPTILLWGKVKSWARGSGNQNPVPVPGWLVPAGGPENLFWPLHKHVSKYDFKYYGDAQFLHVHVWRVHHSCDTMTNLKLANSDPQPRGSHWGFPRHWLLAWDIDSCHWGPILYQEILEIPSRVLLIKVLCRSHCRLE